MPKNFLQKERQRIFRELTKQYQGEGYYKREAKRMARRDTDDIMADKKHLWITLCKIHGER